MLQIMQDIYRGNDIDLLC